MIFPNYEYKNFHQENKEQWVLQPPTLNNWCKMVNASYNYCKNLIDVFEFEKYGVKPCELPSEHPYWKLQSYKSTIKLIDETRGLNEQAKKYISGGGFYSQNALSYIQRNNESIKYYCSKLNFNYNEKTTY